MGVTRAAVPIVAALILSVAVPARAAPSEIVARAGTFLVRTQMADGEWTASAMAEDVAEGVTGLVAAEASATAVTKALNYVAAHGPADANRASPTARVILAAVAAGRNPRDFGKVDYVGRLRTYYNPNNGTYDASTEPTALAIIALVAAAEAIPPKAVTSLQARQCGDGGFPRNTCLFGSDMSATALALSALGAAGVGRADPVIEKARSYLTGGQNADGGFGELAGQPTAAVATGLVVSALLTIGEDPNGAPWLKSPTSGPLTALAALQHESGGLRANASTTTPDSLTTARALPGFAARALPVRPPRATTASTSTTVAPAEAPPSTTSTTRRTGSRGVVATTAPPPVTSPATTPDSRVGLAAPAGNDAGGGRSLVGLLPFIATLFGAGAVGVVLRRRARI